MKTREKPRPETLNVLGVKLTPLKVPERATVKQLWELAHQADRQITFASDVVAAFGHLTMDLMKVRNKLWRENNRLRRRLGMPPYPPLSLMKKEPAR